MILLAVDPSSAWSGWAVFDERHLVAWGRVRGVIEAPDGADRIVSPAGVMRQPRADRMVVEHVTFSRGRAAVVRLAEARAVWETCGRLAGVPVERVNSQTWQASMLGAGRRDDRKAAAVRCALGVIARSGLAAPDKLTDDEADAICLGAYATHPLGMARRRRDLTGGVTS